jgi:hypothetical protein
MSGLRSPPAQGFLTVKIAFSSCQALRWRGSGSRLVSCAQRKARRSAASAPPHRPCGAWPGILTTDAARAKRAAPLARKACSCTVRTRSKIRSSSGALCGSRSCSYTPGARSTVRSASGQFCGSEFCSCAKYDWKRPSALLRRAHSMRVRPWGRGARDPASHPAGRPRSRNSTPKAAPRRARICDHQKKIDLEESIARESSLASSDERLQIEHFFDVGQQHEFYAPVLLAVGVGAVAGHRIGIAVTCCM